MQEGSSQPAELWETGGEEKQKKEQETTKSRQREKRKRKKMASKEWNGMEKQGKNKTIELKIDGESSQEWELRTEAESWESLKQSRAQTIKRPLDPTNLPGKQQNNEISVPRRANDR